MDDWCPLDQEGRPLLLRSIKLTELWPLVLSKALLQVGEDRNILRSKYNVRYFFNLVLFNFSLIFFLT